MAEKKLNPEAADFKAKEKAALNPGAKEFEKKASKPFKWNANAAPWLPTSFQAPQRSAKPVVLIVGPPGSGKGTVGQALAKEFSGKYWSAASALRQTEAEDKKRAFGTPGRGGVLWHDTLDCLKALDEMLASTKGEEGIKGYFLDAQGRNAQQFFYLCGVLRKHHLAPGQVLSLDCDDDDRLVKQVEKAAEGKWAGEKDCRMKLAQYRFQDLTRKNVLAQAKGLTQNIDATKPEAEVLKDAVNSVKMVYERPLGYSLPHNAESPCLTPVEDVYEYNYVCAFIQEKVSSGEARWPCSQAAGSLEKAEGGKIVNTKEAKPEDAVPGSTSHMISKKPDGTRYLLVYLPQYKDRSKGSFFLVPKHMEVMYTFRPRVGTRTSEEDAPKEYSYAEYDVGMAPLYVNTTGNSGIFSFAMDGDLVKLSTGWGGLQGMGCQQWKFIANDMLYFEPEKPREHLARNMQWTLEKRLVCMQRLGWPEADECNAGANGITLCTKTYYGMESLPSLISSIEHQSDSYKNTGLVFTPVRKYMLWRDPSLCVWSHSDHNCTLLVAKKKEDTVLTLHARGTADAVASVKVDGAETADAADGRVCQVRAESKDGKAPGADCTWQLVNIRGDLPMGVDDAGLKKYLEPATWIASKEISKQLSKASMKRDGDGAGAKSPKGSPPRRSGGRGGGGGGGNYGGYGGGPRSPRRIR